MYVKKLIFTRILDILLYSQPLSLKCSMKPNGESWSSVHSTHFLLNCNMFCATRMFLLHLLVKSIHVFFDTWIPSKKKVWFLSHLTTIIYRLLQMVCTKLYQASGCFIFSNRDDGECFLYVLGLGTFTCYYRVTVLINKNQQFFYRALTQ